MNPLLIQFSLYIIVGSALIVSNLMLLLAVGRSRVLRRKYAVLVSQFVTDALSGLAQICAGAGRISILLTVADNVKRSRRYCMLMPWNLLFVWTDPMSAIVLLIISIDRLLTLTCPVAYFNHSLRFQIVQIFFWHTFMFSSIFTSWTLAFPENEPKYDPICWSSASMVEWYTRYSFLLRMSAVVASIVLYLLVCLMSRRHGQNLGGAGRLAFDARQRHLTVTMGISCVFTVLLYLLPVSLEYFLDGSLPEGLEPFLTTYSLISTNLNPIVNVYIIVRRHADVARALWTLWPWRILRLRQPPQMQAIKFSVFVSAAQTVQSAKAFESPGTTSRGLE